MEEYTAPEIIEVELFEEASIAASNLESPVDGTYFFW